MKNRSKAGSRHYRQQSGQKKPRLAILGLKQTARNFCAIEILSFDLAAIAQYEKLRATYRRLGQNDLKIAAIAIVRDAILLTRNQKDFGQITELKSQDCSG